MLATNYDAFIANYRSTEGKDEEEFSNGPPLHGIHTLCTEIKDERNLSLFSKRRPIVIILRYTAGTKREKICHCSPKSVAALLGKILTFTRENVQNNDSV